MKITRGWFGVLYFWCWAVQHNFVTRFLGWLHNEK